MAAASRLKVSDEACAAVNMERVKLAMNESICGLENELALGIKTAANRPKLGPLAQGLLVALKQQIPSLPCREGNQAVQGLMCANGVKVYLDGPFVEVCSAECRRPEEALSSQRAGELLLLRSLPQAARRAGLSEGDITVTRAVTDYSGEFYCGAHVNILTRHHSTSDLVDYLVPFLATRYYACAGGWSSSGFVNSHKANAIECVSSKETRRSRPILNLKAESLASPQYKRIHLTHQDATMAEHNTYLNVACSAVVIHMLDHGAVVGPSMALEDPVAAVRQIDLDLTWKRPLRLRYGGKASALQIQEHYLRAAELYVSKSPTSWMQQAVGRWRQTLDALKTGPQTLTDTLDGPIKMRLYSHILHKHGMTMKEFSAWCGAIGLIRDHLGQKKLPRRGVRETLRDMLPYVTFMLLEERMEKQRLSWSSLSQALRLWDIMVSTDLEYHSIRPSGLFWQLQRSGAVNSRIVTDEEINRAIQHAPRGTRAEARETGIRELAGGEGGTASWPVVTGKTRQLDLQDPFCTRVVWKPVPPPTKKR